MTAPAPSRQPTIDSLASTSFDLCVIGGGATGAGCALDAQTRGLSTVLLDAGDFSCATSSASTKLVHGGVRYLQQAFTQLDAGQYHVVVRALRERILMIGNAPFLAHPMRFVIPCTNWFQAIYYGFGMKVYEWVSGKASLFTSGFYSKSKLADRVPHLRAQDFLGGVVYADGQFDDARYNLMLVKTFTENGGHALNYARVTSFVKDAQGKITAAIAQDQVTGASFEIRARAFVNATGPFADALRQQAHPGTHDRLRVSRGSHILVPLEKMPSADALMIPKTADGRLIFVIPWLGSLLIGTTDDESTVHDNLMIKSEEIDYLLHYANLYLDSDLTRKDIRACFVGLRPLVCPAGASGKATKKLIRDHEVEVDSQSGLVNILGGKWTTYRAMAEDTIDAVQKQLGQPVGGCRTQKLPLAGSEGYRDDTWQTLVALHGITEASARHLTEKFGTRAAKVMALADSDAGLRLPLVAGHAILRAEVVYSIQQEMAASIEDVLARRVGLQFHDWQASIAAAPAVAAYLAAAYSWSPDQQAEAVRHYTGHLEAMLQHAGLSPA
jgi:glycerol-3-phosphate dehydrogenase